MQKVDKEFIIVEPFYIDEEIIEYCLTRLSIKI
jgi:hypothetical protein